MKTLILSSAAALALTGAAFADDGAFYTGDRSTGDPAYVITHFNEDGDTWRVILPGDSDVRVSTSDEDLATFAAAKLDNGERGDN